MKLHHEAQSASLSAFFQMSYSILEFIFKTQVNYNGNNLWFIFFILTGFVFYVQNPFKTQWE